MCECEKIEALEGLLRAYRAEEERYRLEHEVFGNAYLLQLAEDRARRIVAVEARRKELTPCADCAYQRAKREEEAAKKQRGENWRRVLETVADVAVLKACGGAYEERMAALEKNMAEVNEILYDPGE